MSVLCKMYRLCHCESDRASSRKDMFSDLTVHTRAQGTLGQLEGLAHICCQRAQALCTFEAVLLVFGNVF